MAYPRAGTLGAALVAVLVGSLAASFAVAQTQNIDQRTSVDASIRPADDFYHYANGPWLAATTLPDGVSRLDTTALLRAENARRVEGLIESAGSSGTAFGQKITDYYSTWLDTGGIEARGLAPLSHDLAVIAAINDRRALAAYLGRTLRLDDGTNTQTESLWGVWVHQGFHDADHYAAHFVQGGLGLPQREDYLDPAPEHAAHRSLYRAHVANVLRAGGFDQPDARAQRVLDLEVAIAATHASRADTDDVFKTDNTWRRADFVAHAPGMDWGAYFSAAGIAPATSFVVWQPQSVIGGAALVSAQPLDAWRDYLAFHLVEHYAGVLPHAIAEEHYAFEAALTGGAAPSAADRTPQAIAATQVVLGDGVGQLYVARYFSPQAKRAATAMVENIRTAFRARLANLDWMAPETRVKALAKLAALRVGLGYPETWIDYSGLNVVRGDAFGNLQRAEAFTYRREVAKLGRPIDPDEWAAGLYPQSVGAVLNLSPNTMQFAAGLLQPPYFDPNGDAASNYGSAGAGIAHEISHSFDEVSNIYDAQGRLGDWWTPSDHALYHAVSAPLAAQLDHCCPRPDVCVRGARVVGESSADLVGLEVAHDAYLLSLHGRPDVVKNGLSGEQRFFIAFAQRWRRQQTDADLGRQIATDNHVVAQCRGDLVRNADAWVSAFDVKPNDQLYVAPEARIHLW